MPRRRIALIVSGLTLLALVGAWIFAARAPNSDPATPADLAAVFERSGDYRRAADTLLAAYRAAPTDEARLSAARALIVAGDSNAAIALLGDPAAAEGAEYARRHMLAEAELRARRFTEAETMAREILAGQPGDGRARLLLARIAFDRGAIATSRSELADAIRAGGPSLPEAWLFRARIALFDDDLDAARAAAARARDAGAAASDLAAVEVEAALRSGDVAAARARLNAPGSAAGPSAQRLAALIDLCTEDYFGAARRLRDIEPVAAAAPYGDLLLARAARLAGDAAQAEARLARALAAAPDNPVLLDATIADLVETKQVDKAGAHAAHLARIDAWRGALAGMGLARARGDPDGVVHAALTAQASAAGLSDGRPPDAFLFGSKCPPGARAATTRAADAQLAALAAALGATGEADLKAAARARASETGDAAAALLAGEALLALGLDDEARAAFMNAERLAPDSARAALGLARLAIRAGDPAAAATALGGSGVDTFEVRAGLARALSLQGKLDEAAGLLAPGATDLAASSDDAAFGVRLFMRANAPERARAVADAARRLRPDDPATVDLFVAAGRLDDAISVARAGWLAAPDDAGRAELYRRLMVEAGRAAEADASLNRIRPGQAASAIADPAAPSDPVASADAVVLEGAGDAAVVTLEAARRDYARRLWDAAAARRFAEALSQYGQSEQAIRVAREACFRTGDPSCP